MLARVEEDKSSSSPTESRLRDEGGKEREALFDFAATREIDLIKNFCYITIIILWKIFRKVIFIIQAEGI